MKRNTKSRQKGIALQPPGWVERINPRQWIAAAVLLFITLLAYIPAFGAGFIWDDPDYVIQNNTLRSLHGLWQMWTVPTSLPQWYPLVHTTFWLEYHVWGLWSPGYHTVNILLHAAGAILLWRLLVRLNIPAAWLAAAIFAVHPVHVESVAWITERKNTLSAFFYFAAALAYFRSSMGSLPMSSREQKHGRAARATYIASLVLFLAAMFSKTVACSLPAAILLVTWWKTGTIAWRDIKTLLPMFVIGIILAGVTAYLERTYVGASGPAWTFADTPGGEFVARSLIAGRAIWFYAGKIVWPYPLAFMYERWHIDLRQFPQYVYPVTAAAVVLMLWAMRKRIGRGPLVAVLYFIGTLFPALGYFNIYPMQFSFVADHFQHLASIGLTTLAAAGVYRVGGKRPWLACLIVLIPLTILSINQCLIYSDAETLWRDTMRKTPNSWMVYTNLARVMEGDGRALEAIPYHEKALELEPKIHDTHQNVAEGRLMQGRLDEAEREFKLALAVKPNFAPAYVGLAKLELFHRHDASAAERYLKGALAASPTYAPAHYAYGVLLEKQGNTQAAVEHYRAAVADYADDFDSQYDLGSALIKLHRPAEAVGPLREAVRIAPESHRGWMNLAAALQMSGDTEGAAEARTQAMRAVRE